MIYGDTRAENAVFRTIIRVMLKLSEKQGNSDGLRPLTETVFNIGLSVFDRCFSKNSTSRNKPFSGYLNSYYNRTIMQCQVIKKTFSQKRMEN